MGPDKNGPSLETYAEAAGMKDMYHTAYTVFCGAVHSGAKDLQGHLDATTPEEVKEIRYGVSDEGVDSLMLTTAELMLMSIEAVIDRFGIQSSTLLESVREEHNRMGKEITEQDAGPVSPEAAPSASPDEPSA